MEDIAFRYTVNVVGNDEDGYTAHLYDDPKSPMRGWGESPLQAVRALCESIREWPISGAERWLATPDGEALARQFVPDFRGKPGASS